ncbi:RrF2 family transcriptional regulator [Oribacterium sp.]
MLISTKGQYALQLMIDLAEHNGQGYIPLKEIAARQDISEKYLESIVKVLVKKELLLALRGKGGGYKLKRPVAEYSLLEILTALEGSLSPVSDLEKRRGGLGACKTYPVWKELDRMIQEYFQEKTLLELATPDLVGNDFVI